MKLSKSFNKPIKMNKSKIKNKTKKQKPVFTLSDYNSGDGMLVSVWGPSLWNSLHIISFNYPIHPRLEDKKHYRDFILNLEYVLPCKFCRQNLHTNFKQLPLTIAKMKNRETFSRYIYDLHELVNKMLHKKSNLTYEDVRERYEHFRSRCVEEKPKLSKKTMKNRKKEKGCTEPLYGEKSKCIIKIVPQQNKEESFQMDEKCFKRRAGN